MGGLSPGTQPEGDPQQWLPASHPAPSIAAERPAYGDEVNGLGFIELCRADRLAGFAGGLLVLVCGVRRDVGGGLAPGSCPT